MAPKAKYRWAIPGKLYAAAEKAVIGEALRKTPDSREHYNIKLIFDYLFFHILLILPEVFFTLYFQNMQQLLLYPFFLAMCLLGMSMLKKRVSTPATGAVASFTTLVFAMLSSFLNNQDITLCYGTVWILSILFCYLTTTLPTTLIMGSLLCGYLGLAAYIKVHHVISFAAPGYSIENLYGATPVITALYILFTIRVLGRHYNHIMIMEQRLNLQKQKQHAALIRQNLTKQFILVKGLSRSGKTKYLEGNLELLEACLTEIEKQCETAIDLLQQHTHPVAELEENKKAPL
jgi:hypothetical protein